jgi:hypothetical protein
MIEAFTVYSAVISRIEQFQGEAIGPPDNDGGLNLARIPESLSEETGYRDPLSPFPHLLLPNRARWVYYVYDVRRGSEIAGVNLACGVRLSGPFHTFEEAADAADASEERHHTPTVIHAAAVEDVQRVIN